MKQKCIYITKHARRRWADRLCNGVQPSIKTMLAAAERAVPVDFVPFAKIDGMT